VFVTRVSTNADSTHVESAPASANLTEHGLVHRLIRDVHEGTKFASVFKLLKSDWVNHPSVSVH